MCAHTLRSTSAIRLKAVVVGGCPAPSSAAAFKRSVAGDAPTMEEIKRLLEGPAAAGSGGSTEKFQMLLSALIDWYSSDMIADHAMFRSTLNRYLDPTCPPPAAISVPLIACYGRKDDTLNVDDVASWYRYSAGEYEFKVLPEASHSLFAEAPFIRWLQARVANM